MADTEITWPPGAAFRVAGSFTTTPYLYICDSLNNRVQVTDLDGNFLFSFGSYGTGNGQFKSPYGVSNDGEKVYVTDSGNNRVQVFDLEGNYLYQWGSYGSEGGEFSGPRGIASDWFYVYVIDSGNNRFQIFTHFGELVQSVGEFGSGEDQFNSPTNCYVDPYFLYIDDAGNSRVVMYPLRPPETNFYYTVPMRSVTASAVISPSGLGSFIVPMRVLSAGFTASVTIAGSQSIPMRSVLAGLSVSIVLSVDAQVPMRTASSSFMIEVSISGTISVPMRNAFSFVRAAGTEVFSTIIVNTENFAPTQFTNYEFNSYAYFNGKYLGAGSGGVYLLEGPDDAGIEIPIVVKMKQINIYKDGKGQEPDFMRKVADSSFTGITEGPWILKIYSDDPYATREGEILDTGGELKQVRVKQPKGAKEQFITPEVRNQNGTTGSIDSVRLLIQPLPKRTR